MEQANPTQPINSGQNNSGYQKPYTLDENVEAALAYFIMPFSGAIIYYFERENKFIRFHAIQSVLLGIAAFAAMSIANMLIIALIGLILAPIVSVAIMLVWFLMMYKAYMKEEYELPVIGKIARDQLNK